MVQYDLKQSGRWVYIRPFPCMDLLQKIENELTYTKKGAEFMPNPMWAQVKMYQRGRGRFPIGLLHRVERVFKSNEFDYIKSLKNQKEITNTKETTGLYDFQKSAVKMFIIRRGGILQIPTGGGKTRTALSIIDTLKVKTLVVVPSLMLKDQWEKQVPDNVDVRTYQSLKSKSYLNQFKLVIADECHIVAAKSLQLIGLNLNEETLTLGLSATPFMRDDDNLKVEGVLGPIIYKIGIRELIDEGYLVDAVVHYHTLEHMDTTFMDYPMAYSKYITNNTERNSKIVELSTMDRGKILILVNHIDHGETLFRFLSMMEEDVIFLHGSTRKKDRNVNHRIVIATSIMDEGVDIPHLQTLILAGGGKSSIKTTQRIGRVLRKFPGKEQAVVHDFKDNCKWLGKHYERRREIYEKDFEVVDD